MAYYRDSFIFLFGIQEFIRLRLVPGEYEYSDSKNWGPLDGHQNKMAVFSKKKDFD
jgi:hypothetical protein